MNRLKLHRMIAWISGIPIFFVLVTGILLQVKGFVPWIQPPEVKGRISDPVIDLRTILEASRGVPVAQVQGWKDIRSIDVRPSRGVARVRTQSNYEISVDLTSAQVLQVAPRRTNVLIELHEGSFFGAIGKYGIYLPTGVLFLILWGSGVLILLNRRKYGSAHSKSQQSPRKTSPLPATFFKKMTAKVSKKNMRGTVYESM